MQQQAYQFTVNETKTRLDKFLSEQIFDVSRGKIQKDIEAGAVQVNSKIIDIPKTIVKNGDAVVYSPVLEQKPGPVNIPLVELYNHDGLLMINKPAGLAVHPGAGLKDEATLAQALLYHYPEIVKVGQEDRHGIVHRLDKETSGVMAVALTQQVYLNLKEIFLNRKANKEYIALVCGAVQPDNGFIEQSIGKSKRDFRKYTTDVADMVREKPSKTEFHVLERLTDGIDNHTLIAVKLHTGRTHQIRVHFNSLGFPLVGDKLYGGKKATKLEITRQALHASKLEIPLQNGKLASASAKLPEDFTKLLIDLDSKTVNHL